MNSIYTFVKGNILMSLCTLLRKSNHKKFFFKFSTILSFLWMKSISWIFLYGSYQLHNLCILLKMTFLFQFKLGLFYIKLKYNLVISFMFCAFFLICGSEDFLLCVVCFFFWKESCHLRNWHLVNWCKFFFFINCFLVIYWLVNLHKNWTSVTHYC